MKKIEFIKLLEKRFNENMGRHPDMDWNKVQEALENSPNLDILLRMEEFGGEVDVVKKENERFIFFDCTAETPICRRSLCYDEAALNARKNHKPRSSAEQMAKEIGAEILDEEDYLYLQSLGDFDVKTQSWIRVDDDFRKTGDALFANKRHGRTFIYYNGAQSYYGVRGFRCKVKI